MLPEGRREINESVQRLAAANARASSATEMMESAREIEFSSKKMLEIVMRNCEVAKENAASARANLDGSREEVRVAEALLKEAMARWENVSGVKDVEVMSAEAAASSMQTIKPISPWAGSSEYNTPFRKSATDGFEKTVKTGEWEGKKVKYTYNRGKLNMSIEEVTGIEALMKEAEEMRVKDAMSAAAPPKQREVIDDAAVVTPAATATTSTGDKMVVDVSYDCAPSGSLVVEGCGLSELNGIFTKDESQSDGSPKYVKRGTWKGKDVEYNVCRDKLGYWWFSAVDENKVNLYHIRAPAFETPPENGWKVCAEGIAPAPSCRVVA